MIKNVFYFTLKLNFLLFHLSFLRYLNFCPDFSCQESGLIRTLNLISKSMTAETGKQIIAILILASISGSEDNQIMETGRFIDYNLKIFFLNDTQNVFKPFLKIQNLTYLSIRSLNIYTLFYCTPKLISTKVS